MATELVVPISGYKNHIGTDVRHGFIRTYEVTDAAAHDGGQLDALIDRDNTASGVWADTAYRPEANVARLAKRGLKAPFQYPKPRGRTMAPNVRHGNASRARIRSRVEHVFAAQKRRFDLVIRTIGLARATAKLALANLVTNMLRLPWFETRAAPG